MGDLLVERLGLLRVRARQNPAALALGDERRLEVRLRHRVAVVDRVRELERALDVLAGRLEVALALVAARAPFEDQRPKPVARHAGLVGELQRLREQADRGRDRGKVVAAGAEAEEHVRAIHVREGDVLRELAGPLEQADRVAHLAEVHLRPGLGRERAQLEIRSRDARERVGDAAEDRRDAGVVVRLERGLRAGDDALDALALAGGDAVQQEARRRRSSARRAT